MKAKEILYKTIVILTILPLIVAGFLAAQPPPVAVAQTEGPSVTGGPPDWDKSSLQISGACYKDDSTVKAEVCNVGEDMAGTTNYEVWHKASGNPKDGGIAPGGTGTVPALDKDECATLSYTPSPCLAGNFMFKVLQRPGHPGTGELWSEQCSLTCPPPPPAGCWELANESGCAEGLGENAEGYCVNLLCPESQNCICPPEEPTCDSWSVTPGSGYAPLDVVGNGSFSDQDNQVTSTYVEWGDSSTSDTGLNPTNVSHQYGSVGTFVSQLVLVTGGGEIRDEDCQDEVEVNEVPPEEPTCDSWSVTPGSGYAPLDVVGNGSFSDQDNQVTSTYVEWGDGNSSNTGLNPTNVPHTYGSVGTFVSQLVLVTGEGEIREEGCQSTVEVGEEPPPPEDPGCELRVIEIVNDPGITLQADWWNGTAGPHPLNWDDGNITQLFGPTGSEVMEHNYSSGGARDITFTVYGAEGKTAICRASIEFKEEEEYGPPGLQIRLIAYFDGTIEGWSSDCQRPTDGCRSLFEFPSCTLAATDGKGCLINPMAVEDIYIKSALEQVAMGERDAHGRDNYIIMKRWLEGEGEETLCVIRPVVPKWPKGVEPHYPDVIVYIDDIPFTFDEVHYQAFQTLDWYAMVGNE